MRQLLGVEVEPGARGVEVLREALTARLHDDGPALAPLPQPSRHISPGYADKIRQAVVAHRSVPDDVAVAVATSGSTGRPRIVMITADNLRASMSAAVLARPGLQRCDWLLALPATSIGGLNVVARAALQSTPLHILPSVGGASAFEPKDLLVVQTDRPLATSLVPSQLAAILEDRAATGWLAALHTVLIGGAATPEALVRRARDAGIAAVTTYGMTESTGGCVFDGVALDGVAISVDDSGRIIIGGPTVAAGYLDEIHPSSPPASAGFDVSTTGHALFRTNDHGRWEHGRLHVHGRLDDVVTVHGVNVALGPIETIVMRQPGIAEAAVVAHPDPNLGHRLTAYVVADDEVDLDDVSDVVREHLGGAARPRMVRVDALPRVPNGKIDRLSLRSRGD